MEGARLREVCFTATAQPGQQVLVYLTSLTDNAGRVEPFLAVEDGDGLYRLGLLLPDDGRFSYCLVTAPSICTPPDRSGWAQLRRAGRADPANPNPAPSPFGGSASLYLGPAAAPDPWCLTRVEAVPDGQLVPLPGWQRQVMVSAGEPDGPVLVLFDGQWWSGSPTVIRRICGPSWSVLAIDSVSLAQRAVDLPDPHISRALFTAAVQAAEPLLGHMPVERLVVAGQSFGGLAAVNTVLAGSALAAAAVIQSASLWWNGPTKVDRQRDGQLMRAVLTGQLPAGTKPRLFVQAGSEELQLGPLNRRFAEAATAAGLQVDWRQYRSGHDAAFWRMGLVDALSEWDRT